MAPNMEIKQVPISKLKLASYNPRTHPDKAIEVLVKSIENYGFTNPILTQKKTNIVIAGHARIKAAQKLGIKQVPVIYLDFDEVTAKAYTIMDNRSAELTEWDYPALKDLTVDIDLGNIDISLTGFDELELKEMFDHEGLSEDGNGGEGKSSNPKKLKCPECGFEFEG